MSKNLRDLKLKIEYTTRRDNPVDEFLVPCLNHAVEYNVITGFFSTNLFIQLFYQIGQFLKRGGKIKAITGWLNKTDINLIKNDSEILEALKINIDEVLTDLEKESPFNYKILCYLIGNKQIEIRFGSPIDEFDQLTVKNLKILHEKIGYFKDADDNIVSWRGSPNLTSSGWFHHRESIDVFCNWIHGEDKRVEQHMNKFIEYWEGDDKTLFVCSIKEIPSDVVKILSTKKPEAITDEDLEGAQKEYIKKAPKAKPKPNKETGWLEKSPTSFRSLIEGFPFVSFQIKAMKSILENDGCNILKMATGTGKTMVSIGTAHKITTLESNKGNSFLILVIVPDLFLIGQWKRSLKDYIDENDILTICSDTSVCDNWKKYYLDLLRSLRDSKKRLVVFIGTQASLRADLLEKITQIFDFKRIICIYDEVHTLGARKARENIELFEPKYRIGLSATPEREYEKEETDFIYNWFKTSAEKQFKFSIRDAQNIDFLETYKLYFKPCSISNENLERYIELSAELNRIHGNNEDADNFRIMKVSERAAIIKEEVLKDQIVEEIVIELLNENRFYNCVIYCLTNNQADRIIGKLKRLGKERKEDFEIRKVFGEQDASKRDAIIGALTARNINAVVAMKVLDQGVDIPSLEITIFVASSTSDREHIQRLGRVLRKARGEMQQKDVRIYDILAIPSEEQKRLFPEVCEHIQDVESERAETFIDYCNNKEDHLETLKLFLN